MRIDKRLPGLALAAILGATLIACQRQEMPSTRIDLGLPAVPDGRFSAPLAPGANREQAAPPGFGGTFDPHHPPTRRPGLIET
jgi:hypothetical protein